MEIWKKCGWRATADEGEKHQSFLEAVFPSMSPLTAPIGTQCPLTLSGSSADFAEVLRATH